MAYKTKIYGSPAMSGPMSQGRYSQQKLEFRPTPKLLRELQGNEGTAEIDWERGANGMIEITAINGISIGRMDKEEESEEMPETSEQTPDETPEGESTEDSTEEA